MNDNGYISREFISRQISVYKTDKKLVELIDKLNPAPLELYAHIHARGDDAGDNRRVYSNIGIILQDYSAGTGQNTRCALCYIHNTPIFFRAKLRISSTKCG